MTFYGKNDQKEGQNCASTLIRVFVHEAISKNSFSKTNIYTVHLQQGRDLHKTSVYILIGGFIQCDFYLGE